MRTLLAIGTATFLYVAWWLLPHISHPVRQSMMRAGVLKAPTEKPASW